MSERTKKPLPKRKEKKPPPDAPRAKQTTLLDMFAAKATKPPVPITIESSPELPDTTVIPNEGTSAAAFSAGDHCDDGVALDLTSGKLLNPTTSEQSTDQPPPHEPQTPFNRPIALPEYGTSPATDQGLRRPASSLVQKVEGMTPSKPIVIDSSPVKELNSRVLPKPGATHPFFVPRGNTTKQKAPQILQKSKGSAANGWPVSYPDRDSQHVKGPQSSALTSFGKPPPWPTASGRAREGHENSGYGFLAPGLRNDTRSHNVVDKVSPKDEQGFSAQQYVSTIPADHLAHHPAISRLIDRSITGTLPQTPTGRSLTEKWRPRCAEEVLGNEASARYLRDWLRALELQLEIPDDSDSERLTKRDSKAQPNKSRKRPRVITEVVRQRYRKRVKAGSDEEDDSWIVEDDEEDEEEDYNSSHYTSDFDSEPMPAPSSPHLSTSSIPDTGSEIYPTQPAEPSQDLGVLHNTILLVGPPGSGKTASVYACAEELGWEVFEVYPGIGRRNGTSVENLVGEVGKNHLVRQRPHGRHDFFVFSSPSKRKQGVKSKSDPASEDGRKSVPLTGSEIEDAAPDRPPSMAQSLILLEEVDILFKDDTRFWESVKEIIRECKRPIICTCNDISLIPLAELPLQRVLDFNACPSDILTSYLQGICCAEGRSVDRMVLSRCLASREDQDPRSLEHVVDIRRAINSLDFSLTTGFSQLSLMTEPSVSDLESEGAPGLLAEGGGNDAKEEELARCRKAVYDADLASYFDSELCRNALDRPVAIEIESLGPTNDDELGHPILHDTRRDASLPSTYARDIDMGTIIEDRMRAGHGDAHSARTLREKRALFLTHYRHVLRDVVPQRVWATMEQAHLFTDYAPFIKQVAEADEAQAVSLMQMAQEKKGRRTRNSALSSYVRTLDLSDEGREGLGVVCFRDFDLI